MARIYEAKTVGGTLRQVTAAVIIENGLLFLARRGPREKLAGLWELPGGKVEQNESLQQCLERELMEELDMNAVAENVLASTTYAYEHGSFEMTAISVTRQSDYRLTVHDLARWVSRDDLQRLDVAPADVALLDELLHQGIW
jgi:8-oxo-dGTP diphosphatase